MIFFTSSFFNIVQLKCTNSVRKLHMKLGIVGPKIFKIYEKNKTFLRADLILWKSGDMT